MNHKPILVELPKEPFYLERYTRYAIVFITATVHASPVEEDDIMAHFKDRDGVISRRVTYNPNEGRIFYITDLQEDSALFWNDLYNRLCYCYFNAAYMLDRISNAEYEDESDEDIPRRIARYEKWNDEVEHLDSLLTNINFLF